MSAVANLTSLLSSSLPPLVPVISTSLPADDVVVFDAVTERIMAAAADVGPFAVRRRASDGRPHLTRHGRRSHRTRQDRRRDGEDRDGKRRRSLNIHDPDKPKEQRLFKARQSSVVEVYDNGTVSTTVNGNSLHCQYTKYLWDLVHRNQWLPVHQILLALSTS